jgi:hypothetical protein
MMMMCLVVSWKKNDYVMRRGGQILCKMNQPFGGNDDGMMASSNLNGDGRVEMYQVCTHKEVKRDNFGRHTCVAHFRGNSKSPNREHHVFFPLNASTSLIIFFAICFFNIVGWTD